MFEEIKEILVMLAQAGGVTLTAALSIVVAFGIYKLLTLASILVLIKFIVEKVYNYAITKKVNPVEEVKYSLKNSNICVSDEIMLMKISMLSQDLVHLRYNKDLSGIEYRENWLHSSHMEECIKVLNKALKERMKELTKEKE